jgi:hypothetical protein
MQRFEVFYTYCIDASTVVEADDSEAAEVLAEQAWKKGDCSKEKLQDFSDFEILNTKKLLPLKQ